MGLSSHRDNKTMKYGIQHNQNQHRFEVAIDDLNSVIDYSISGANLSLNSVRVPKALEGRGIAGELTQAALDWARTEKYRVIPVCPYVQTWLRRHPDYANLVA